ncbi:MAG: LapA family protein [Sedimentisphaerales bacterium]|nr:LapA family protein [Sedimentisphaerales bacterium]
MKKAKIIVLIVSLVLVLIVALQNTKAVETKVLFLTVTMPRVLLLLLTFIIGLIAGMILATGILRKSPAKKAAQAPTKQP